MSSSKSSTFFFAVPPPWLPGLAAAADGSRRAPPPPELNSASPPAAAKQLHAIRDDLRRVFLDAVLVRVLARLQPALDVDGAPFLQEFAGDFRLAPEEHDAMPFGALLLLAALVLPLLGGRDVEVGDGVAAGRVARLGIAAEIAEQDHLVDRSHVVSLDADWN